MRFVKLAGKPGDFARRGVFRHRALGRGFVERFHRLAQGGFGGLRVASRDRFLSVLGGRAHARFDRPVARLALEALAMTLAGRRMVWNMRHNQN